MQKLIATLDPTDSAATSTKSRQHQIAAISGGMVMGRSTVRPDAATGVFLSRTVRIRNLMARTLLEESAEVAEFAFRECGKAVDPLVNGDAVHLKRYELPPGHALSAPHAGHPCDELLLGVDDVVRET